MFRKRFTPRRLFPAVVDAIPVPKGKTGCITSKLHKLFKSRHWMYRSLCPMYHQKYRSRNG